MAKRVVDESSLISVADAIRERAGTSEPLVFPEGFKSAVEGIPDLLEQYSTDTLIEYKNPRLALICRNFLYKCTSLKSVYLPAVTLVEHNAFEECTNLSEVNIPKAETLGNRIFANTKVKTLDLPSANRFYPETFWYAPLEALILRGNKIPTLDGSGFINNTPIASGTGFIYVPRSLLDSYKTATNWSAHASKFRAIEDYPEITGGAV